MCVDVLALPPFFSPPTPGVCITCVTEEARTPELPGLALLFTALLVLGTKQGSSGRAASGLTTELSILGLEAS